MEDFFASFDWASYATKHRLKGRIQAIAHFVHQNKFNLKITRLPEEFLTIKNPAPKSLPGSVDLRSKFPECYDQGQLGACTANALVAAYQYLVPEFMGSRLFVYYNERVIENQVKYDSGAYIHDGVNALETYGLPPETIWPYNISKFATKPPLTVYIEALKHKVVKAYTVTQTVNTMKALLHSGKPFVIGIVVYQEFLSYSVATTGLVPYPNSASVALGGYCVLVVGYNDSIKCPGAPPGAWLCRNSYGIHWGLNGYFWLPMSYLTNTSLSSDNFYLETTTG
jgi:C1A family cysteine protease